MGVLGVLFAVAGLAWAGPQGVPTEAVLRRLIAEQAEVPEDRVTVAIVLPGTAITDGGFRTDDAARVVFIWYQTVEGRSVRRVEERTYYWNETYGWFTYSCPEVRGGQLVEIYSQKQGLIEIR